MSQQVASKTFGIPQPTISDYIRYKQGTDDRKPGCKPVFSQKVEEKIGNNWAYCKSKRRKYLVVLLPCTYYTLSAAT